MNSFIQETQKHIKNVGKYMSIIIQELIQRIVSHDMSKIGDETERTVFIEYTPKLNESTYGSDEYKTFLKEMGKGLEHHYRNNNHHPEFYENGIKGMNLIDLVEMLCDWKAATLRHKNGDLHKSIEQNQKRFNYGDEIKQIFFNTIQIFEEEEIDNKVRTIEKQAP